MSWWWAGAVGAARKKFEEDEAPRSFQSVGLVIGVTGIVGNSLAEILPLADTPGGPWKVYGVARRPRPNWNADHPIEYIQCDISDPNDTESKLSGLTDVTHIFYVSWANRPTEAENLKVNGAMLTNVLRAVVLAEEFGIEEYGFEEGSNLGLSEMMKGKGAVWEEIVRENQLQPTKLEAVGDWWFVDVMFGGAGVLDSMNKANEHGFSGFRNSKNSFLKWIEKTKAYKIVP